MVKGSLLGFRSGLAVLVHAGPLALNNSSKDARIFKPLSSALSFPDSH